MPNNVFQFLKTVFSFLGDISLFAITVMTFYKTTYCKKLKLSAMYSLSDRSDSTIITFKIISRSLMGLIITNVEWIIDETWRITLVKDNTDTPIELPAMGICDIKTKPYSVIKEKDLLLDTFQNKKWYLLITLSDGSIRKVPWKKKFFLLRWYYTRKGRKLYQLKSPSFITCYHSPSGLLLTPYIKYMVKMNTQNGSSWFKIYKSGVMGKTIGGYNGLPKTILDDPSLILETLKRLDNSTDFEIETVDESVFDGFFP